MGRVSWYQTPVAQRLARAAGSVARQGVRAAVSRHPMGRMAVMGYDAFRFARRNLFNGNGGNSRGTSTSRRRGGSRWFTNGMYQGRVRRVTRKGARTRFDKYNRSGVVHSSETIGSVTDQDCVYIMNEVINSRDVVKYMVAAVFRKLIEKAGIRVTGMDRSPFDKDAGDANELQYHITVVRQNMVSGASTSTTKDILAGDSFNDIVDFFKNLFEQYCSGFGELNNQNVDEPQKVTLWTGPNDGSSVTILSMMFFNEVFIDLYGTSEVKVQNRTKATDNNAGDIENVNNNPLQGWNYLFSGVPKPKGNSRITGGTNSATVLFERMPYPKGVSQFGAALALSPDFKEPAMPRQFWNCPKASRVVLEPGAIKKFQWAKKKLGNFLKILKAIRLQLTADGLWATYSIFPVQMIALEDVINANAAETITVQFEVQRMLGVKCYVKEKKYFTSDYELRT